MKHLLVILIISLYNTIAYAKCTGQAKTLFFCTTNKGKQIEVCDAGKTIDYRFGKTLAKPEIAINVPRDQISTFQWAGIGSTTTYSVNIPNKNTVYTVFWSFDRMEDHAVDAGVDVMINDKNIANIRCIEKDLINNLEGVDLKPMP